MAIPSKAEFESFFTASTWLPDPEWKEAARKLYDLKPEKFAPSDELKLVEILLNATNAKRVHESKVKNHRVQKWFSTDSNASAAAISMEYRAHKSEVVSVEDYAALRTRKINESRYPGMRFNHEIQRNLISVELWRGLVQAFFDYHYTDRWKTAISLGRDHLDLLAEASRAIEEATRKVKRLIPMEDYRYAYLASPSQPGAIALRLIRANESLNFYFQEGACVFPGKRIDEKAKERVLLFDLARVLRRCYGRDKPAALASLLRMEGVQHSLDQRTVERLLLEWKQKRNIAQEVHERARNRMNQAN